MRVTALAVLVRRFGECRFRNTSRLSKCDLRWSFVGLLICNDRPFGRRCLRDFVCRNRRHLYSNIFRRCLYNFIVRFLLYLRVRRFLLYTWPTSSLVSAVTPVQNCAFLRCTGRGPFSTRPSGRRVTCSFWLYLTPIIEAAFRSALWTSTTTKGSFSRTWWTCIPRITLFKRSAFWP